MTPRVHHTILVITILAFTAPGCSSDQCAQQPNSLFCTASDETSDSGPGDTGGPESDKCVPHIAIDEVGYEYTCQGLGNGWLVLDVFGVGVQPPECVNWGPDGKPDGDATTADCIPLDLTMLPDDVPSPGACCTQDALPESVETQCSKDCGYAACTLAIAKIRDAALALPHPDSEGLKKTAEERVRGDLFGLANMLELPEFLAGCAEQVTMANGEPTQVLLGAGMSDDLIGHVNNATLTLQCALDADEPYVLEGGSCESTPNIPLIDGESSVGWQRGSGGDHHVHANRQPVRTPVQHHIRVPRALQARRFGRFRIGHIRGRHGRCQPWVAVVPRTPHSTGRARHRPARRWHGHVPAGLAPHGGVECNRVGRRGPVWWCSLVGSLRQHGRGHRQANAWGRLCVRRRAIRGGRLRVRVEH